MNIDELIANRAIDLHPSAPPQTEPLAAPGNPATDEPAFDWLAAGQAQDAILLSTRVFRGL
jgi:hypothetical protein